MIRKSLELMRRIKEELENYISNKLGVAVELETPKNRDFGDLALPCFVLARHLKKPPQEIAWDLSKALEHELIERLEAVNAYLNIFLKKDALIDHVFNKPYNWPNNHKRLIVEYMNANPNKPLHIGQARNVAIGDTIVRLARLLGYEVHAANYGDDSGVNVGYNIVAHLYYNIPLETGEKFDHFCGRVYTEMHRREHEKEFKERLVDTLLKIEEGRDRDLMELHKKYTRQCVIAQIESCWRLNAYFDLVNWETDILHLKFFEKTIEILKEKDCVKYAEDGDAKGCWILDLANVPEFKNLKHPYQVLIKSDGVATYVAKDIVYAMWKLGLIDDDFYYEKLIKQPNNKYTYTTTSLPNTNEHPLFGNYDIAISVIDKRQSHAQNVVRTALKLMGFTRGKEYIHLPYGVVYITPKTLLEFGIELDEEEKSKEKLAFSSRKGWVITLDESFELVKKHAYNETKQRNPDKTDSWLNEVAENITLAAMRFFLLKSDLNQDIVFDIDNVLEMKGDTGMYVLYTYARISGILAKSGLKELPDADLSLLKDGEDYKLIRKMVDFEDVVIEAFKKLMPSMICNYILELCQLFNSYYSSVPVLKADSSLRNARLKLLLAVQKTLKNALNLIGINELDRV